MEHELNLAELCSNISNKLIDSEHLIEIMDEIIQGEPKLHLLTDLLKENINSAFDDIEKCRHKIYILD